MLINSSTECHGGGAEVKTDGTSVGLALLEVPFCSEAMAVVALLAAVEEDEAMVLRVLDADM